MCMNDKPFLYSPRKYYNNFNVLKVGIDFSCAVINPLCHQTFLIYHLQRLHFFHINLIASRCEIPTLIVPPVTVYHWPMAVVWDRM